MAVVMSVAALALGACSGSPSGVPTAVPAPATPSVTTPGGNTPGPQTDALAPYYTQKITWTGCGGSFQCGKLTVPVDYASPGGTAIKLALIRLPAGDPSSRLGSLILNPGGPGGSGVDYARAARAVVDASVRQRYDIVGFDPRGVAASDPVKCLTDKATDALLSTDGTPDTPAEVAALVGISQGFAAGCATRSAAIFAHIGTANVARDVDVLRAVLGDRRLNWLGASYGTFIGATYADLFPTNVGRMVLDGAIDPALSNAELARGQAKGFEGALRRFVADCDTRTECPLPTGVDAGVARIQQFFATLDANPMPTDSGRPLTESLGMNAVLSYLYFPPSDWEQLRYGLQSAFDGDGSTLMEMLDQRLERSPDGHYKDNSNDALVAVNALDHTDRASPAQIAVQAQQWAKESPTWGPFLAWSDLPYYYWKAPATMTPHRVTAPGSPPILVVGTTYDPATPYPWAQSLAAQLSKGVLLTRVGDGHTGYGMGSDCIDAAIDKFLTTGTAPPAGTICH